MKVAIIGPNLHGANETFHVHAAGCRDTRKPLYAGYENQLAVKHPADVESDRDVVLYAYEDIIEESPEQYGGERGWESLLSEFRFFPCVAGLRTEAGR